jgi:hypothetical protein
MGDEEKKFTEADVNKIVQDRLAADRASRGDPTALLATVQNLQTELAAAKGTISELQGKVSTTDRNAILTQVGLDLKVPAELVGFIQGGTKEEMTASAQKLVAGLGPGNSVGGTTNPPAGNTAPKVYTAAELKTMSPEQINADWANVSKQLQTGVVK